MYDRKRLALAIRGAMTTLQSVCDILEDESQSVVESLSKLLDDDEECPDTLDDANYGLHG